MNSNRTPRQEWTDGIWEDLKMSANQKLVAHAFAKYAGNGIERVSVARSELQRITGLSRSTIIKCAHALESAGWLLEVEKPRQNYSTTYRLAIPSSGVSDAPLRGSGDTPLTNLRGVSEDARGVDRDAQGYRSRTQTTRTARNLNIDDDPLAALEAILAKAGISAEEVDRVLEISASPPHETTSPIGRLTKDSAHRRSCVAAFRAEKKKARERDLASEPLCHECQRPQSVCEAATVKTRDHEFEAAS